MIKQIIYAIPAIMMITSSCNNNAQQSTDSNKDSAAYPQGTFGYDLHFLQQHDDSMVVLKADDNAEIIVSPKYQAKVFTSTANGNEGLSFGWVNYKAFSAPTDAHMNAYGGENRFWLGPEGGRFSLYFKPGAKMEFDNWKTPAPFDTESWNVTNKTGDAITLQKDMQLTNYKGTDLQLHVDRTIQILNNNQIAQNTGLTLDTSVKAVGYATTNKITNKGNEAWTEATGMPCIWMLDMLKTTPATVIVVPYKNAAGQNFKNVATTDYFGEIPADRLKHDDNKLFLKADGKSRGKLGIKPTYAKPALGSYDASTKVLTVVMFQPDSSAKYLNQEWNTTKPTFSGDAVNAYNDGPLADGSQMGPFYEIESVSPAAFLKPNESLTHKHSVYHFTGNERALDAVAQKLLGTSISEIKGAFQ
ncbi:hypothetical protein FC093_03110 [Ilyomonas limi]|uniref:Lipoprotein n=1 Tax=Ilyomonas limi TaxID=2575867 RepID=A0A4U3L9F8_9BACT|nr:DUF6786 family protein [Ilyomonas limi]TKK72015.1 hypothetical protein FC093_03110 [Ilyomonas limi]